MSKPVSRSVTTPMPSALRRRLLLALPSAAALSAPWLVVGCGGGDSAATDETPDTPASVSITMPSTSIRKGATQSITANVSNAPPGELRYRWSVSGSDLANLSAPTGQVGRTFETTSSNVTLGTTPSTLSPLTVTVEVLAPADGGGYSVVATTSATVTLDDNALVAEVAPAEALVERENGTQTFTMTLSPMPTTPNPIRYEWSCPSEWGSLTSGGATTTTAAQAIQSTEPTATYATRSGLDGGEFETVRCVAYFLESDPLTGESTRTDVANATAEVFVKQRFNIRFVGLPPETPSDNTVGVSASIAEALPAGATVEWTWTHSGVGRLTPPGNDANQAHSNASFDSGAAEGRASFTVQARVVAEGRATLVLPVTRMTQVKRGLREITFVATGGVFPCTDPRACGVSAYTAYIVPLYSKAIGYTAVFTEYGYPGCNVRRDSWTNTRTVSDRGDCFFPVTYHPHNATGPTNAFAVWIGFGGELSGPGVCTVTVTLAP
jgi:hypothetical protein